MTEEFSGPSAGSKITDYEGCLLLITPNEVEKEVLTKYGPADATSVDYVVLDGEDAGEEYKAQRVFQKGLQGQMRDRVGTGKKVLGRLGRGQAREGQDPPWLLTDPTEDDAKLAREHLAKQERPPF